MKYDMELISKGTTVKGNGAAFRGSDLVAILNGLGVVPGRAEFTHVYDGVAYYFESEDSRDQFAAAPSKCMPRYGGYCTLGVAPGKKPDGSPRFAGIVDDKLCVFPNAACNWSEMHAVSVVEANGSGS